MWQLLPVVHEARQNKLSTELGKLFITSSIHTACPPRLYHFILSTQTGTLQNLRSLFTVPLLRQKDTREEGDGSTDRRLRSNVSQSLGWSNRRLPSHLRISKCCFSYTIISITMAGSVNSIFSNTGTLQSGSTLIEVPLSKYGKSVHSYQIKPVAVPSTNAESKCHFLLMRPPPGGGLRSSAVSQAPSLSNYSKKRP